MHGSPFMRFIVSCPHVMQVGPKYECCPCLQKRRSWLRSASHVHGSHVGHTS